MRLLLVIIAAVMIGQAQSLVFEAASVKVSRSTGGGIRQNPGRLDITGMTLREMVQYAYDVQGIQVSGGPPWFGSDHWDISATAGRGVSEREQKKMLQSLLTERFRVTIHRETKELSVYTLVVGKNGSKLKPNTEGTPEEIMLNAKAGLFTLIGEDVTVPKIAEALFGQVERIVIDRTGIEGSFDFKLEWVPDAANMPSINGAKMEASTEGPSIFTAVQEQLGLKLESTKGPVEILVIDRAEKATEN
jgi:uncharacterized protein (TIGR03435 family)